MKKIKNIQIINKKHVFFIGILVLFFISLSSINAANINITNSTPGGLNATVTNANDGDIINLDEGVYTNNVTNITINKNLTIVGKNPQTTTIDAQKIGRIFNITPNRSLTLINMTIINGNIFNGNGGAIYVEGKLNIVNCAFNNNNASSGGAIYIRGNNTTINNSTFTNNNATSGGGAIINIGTNITINNSIFRYNKAINGGAIYNTQNNVKISGSTFTNNTGSNGGVILLTGNNTTINSCTFINNNSTTAIIYNTGNNLNITGCNIINNSHGIYIYSTATGCFINYNRIFNNTNYDINNTGNTNANFNWWGNNTPTKVIGMTLGNYFIRTVTNSTPLLSNGNVSFNYTFGLNTNDLFNASLLPHFVTNVYTNVTGLINTFDARFNHVINSTLNFRNQTINYTFINDNEIKSFEIFIKPGTSVITTNNAQGKVGETINLIAKLTDQRGNPLVGKTILFHIAGKTMNVITDSDGVAIVKYTINEVDFRDDKLNFTVSFEGDETYLESNSTGIVTLIIEPIPPTPPIPTNNTTKNTNNSTNNNSAQAAMKKTGTPIMMIILVLFSSLGLIRYKKK